MTPEADKEVKEPQTDNPNWLTFEERPWDPPCMVLRSRHLKIKEFKPQKRR